MRNRSNACASGAMLGRAAATVVAAALGVALLASCSSEGADPSPDATTTAADDAQTQIKQVTQDFITAFNTGKLTDVAPLVCSKIAYTMAGSEDRPESARKAQIDRFESITVNGDSATVKLTVSATGDDAQPAEQVDMVLVDEGGWKICE